MQGLSLKGYCREELCLLLLRINRWDRILLAAGLVWFPMKSSRFEALGILVGSGFVLEVTSSSREIRQHSKKMQLDQTVMELRISGVFP